MRPFSAPLLAGALTAAALLAACGGGSDGGGPDERCFGIAQVPAWKLGMNVVFDDTGSADTFRIRIHQAFDASDTTGGPDSPAADILKWTTGTPHGTIAVADTLIGNGLHDTSVATIASFAPIGAPNGAVLSGMYLAVELNTCGVDLQGQFVGPRDYYLNGAFQTRDTGFVGYLRLPSTVHDSLELANGFADSAVRAKSVTLNSAFGAQAEWRVADLTGPYVKNGATATFDSATVGWSAVPVGAPAGAPMIVNGRIVPRRP